MTKFDIKKVSKKTLSGNKDDPSEHLTMRVPASVKKRMRKIGNKNVIKVLKNHLPKI